MAFWVDLKRRKISEKIPKKILIQKKLEFFFKLKFFTFPFSFLQRLGMNIKCPNVGYLKSISSGQYVFIFCVFSLSKISHFNMRHPVIIFEKKWNELIKVLNIEIFI